MPSGRKGKKLESKSKTTQKSTKLKTGQKFRDSSATASASHYGPRSGLRSRPSAATWSFQDNPESILRKSRKARETKQIQNQPEIPTRGHPESLVKSIEALLGDYSAPVEDSDEETSLSPSDTDSEQTFYRSCGYLPPLDEEAVAVIDAIMADPAIAEKLKRIGPDSPFFNRGLEQRNVFMEESQNPDPYVESMLKIKFRTPGKFVPETEEERNSHGRLWIRDQAKCCEGSNEALFQRTMMMSLISRHCLIYETDATDQRCLDFSVEETWTCPPMPTRAYENKEKFLTQPKPDLAVYFRRQVLIPKELWFNMPTATQRLACCENTGVIGGNRVFHFFTVEAKKQGASSLNVVGKCQSLNNASQALHNMYEFFHDAGPQHEEIFFTKVRFFSVVASTEGLTIRIHRATRQPAHGSGLGFIRPNYPLRFEHRVFSKLQKDINFNRETVLKTFEKILLGYGENELRWLLAAAAETLVEKLRKDRKGRLARANLEFYQHGQVPPKSRKPTPARSIGSVARSETNVSVDMLRSDLSSTATPTQSRASTSRQLSNLGGKRPRGQSDDSIAERSIRQRMQ